MNELQPPPLPKPPRNLLPLAAVLAFLPSAFFLILVMLQQSKVRVGVYCIVGCVLGLACCLASSIILFQRKTALAVVFGVLLAIFNIVLSVFLGCAALIADANIH
jgi:hypothetical protein